MKTFIIIALLLLSQNCFAALTGVTNASMGNIPNLYNGSLIDNAYVYNTGTPFFVSTDFGVNSLVGSLNIYVASGSVFPTSLQVQVTDTPVLTVADANAAAWTTIKTLTGLNPPVLTFITVGFDAPVYARAVRVLFDGVSSAPSTYCRIGEMSFSSVLSGTTVLVTADAYAALQSIKTDTTNILSGGSGGSGSPLDLPGSVASQAVPVHLQDQIKPSDFAFASGLTGILCAYTMILIWSRSL